MATDQLIIFVKAPRPGLVKTRLASKLGAQGASKAYEELVHALLSNLATLRDVTLRYAPDDAQSEIKPWLRSSWVAVAQGNGDLGQRLVRAFADAFATGAERVAIIGSDCPDVTTADIRTALKELHKHDCVVGPATDGGYWLIGLRKPAPQLFEGIQWSTDSVLGDTLKRAREAGLGIQLLNILEDVDTPEDWKRWKENRA